MTDPSSVSDLRDERRASTPTLAAGVGWIVRPGDDVTAYGMTRAEPHLLGLAGWLGRGGVSLVDADGATLGRISTDTVSLGGVDTEVVFWPEEAADDLAADVVVLTVVDDTTLRIAPCPAVPAPTDAQLTALASAFEEAARTETVRRMLSDETVEITTADGEEVVTRMLEVDRSAWRTDPVPPIDDLLASGGLERHDGRVVGRVGTDWEVFDQAARRRRIRIEHGLDADQAERFLLLTGAATTRDDDGRLALGDTVEEIGGAVTLVASLLDDADVASAAWNHWAERGETGEPLQDVVDELVESFGDEPTAGVAWLRSRQLQLAGRSEEAVTVLDGVSDSGHVGVLADLAAFAADRSDHRAARDLLERAGVETDIDLEAPFDPAEVEEGFGAELAEEIAPFVAMRPRPMAGRNDRCPCGSGRKYKNCHLGDELHALEHRAGWLYVKMMRHLGLVAPALVQEIADDVLDDVMDPQLRRMVAGSYLPTDLALHEGGITGRFVDAKRSLLPADELALAEAWDATDRSVYEVVRSTIDTLDVVDLGSRERLTVRDTVPEEPLDEGWRMIGRLLPVEGSHRAYGGFLPVNDDMVDPMLEAFATRRLDVVCLTIGSIFATAEAQDEMQAMFDESLDTSQLEALVAELGIETGDTASDGID